MTLYRKFEAKDLILRDYLALERTIMSNERTLLAYIRTGITILVTGITGLHFFATPSIQIAALMFIATGALFTCYGILRFFSIKKRLNLASPAHSAESTAEEASRSGDKHE